MILLYCSFAKVESQTIVSFEKGMYEYAGELYRYNELEEVFQLNEEAYHLFSKQKQSKKTAGVLGTTSLMAIGFGIVLTIDNRRGTSSCTGSFCGIGTEIGGYVSMLLGGILGVGAVTSMNNAATRKKESIDVFNQKEIIKTNKTKARTSLRLALDGVGIEVAF